MSGLFCFRDYLFRGGMSALFFLETMIAFITRLFIAVCPVGTVPLTECCEMVSVFRHSENSVKTP